MVPGMTIKVRVDGVEYEAGPIWAGDMIAFEKRYDLPAVTIFAGEIRVEHLAFVAWNALKRAGTDLGDFDAYVEKIESISPEFNAPEEGDEGKANPAPNRAQRRGSSRRSSSSSDSPGETSKLSAVSS